MTNPEDGEGLEHFIIVTCVDGQTWMQHRVVPMSA